MASLGETKTLKFLQEVTPALGAKIFVVMNPGWSEFAVILTSSAWYKSR